MNRLQKKCVIASSAFHGLLVLVLLFGAALMPRQEPATFTRITLYALPTDSATSGGSPVVQQAAPPTPPAPSAPPAAPSTAPPVAARPTPPQPVQERQQPPHPVQPRSVVQRTQPRPPVVEAMPRPTHNTLNPNELQMARRTESTAIPTPTRRQQDTSAADAAAASAAAAAEAAANRARVTSAVSGAMRSINDSTSTSSAVNIASGIGEGPLMANYRDIVASKYTAAWNPPAGLEDDAATVIVTVTIFRDGRVIHHEITKRSGNTMMDKSIQTTLENVTFVEVFPAGSRDMQRTFTIKFNLAAKRMLG